MITIRVDEVNRQLSRNFSQLSAQAIVKATANAINTTIRKGRTVARNEVKKAYNVPQRYMSRVGMIPATSNKLVGKIYASTKPIPMDAFNPRYQILSGGKVTGIQSISRRGASKTRNVKRGKVNKGVSIEVKKGDRTIVPFAFLLPSAKPRVFARGEYNKGNGSYGFIQRHTRLNNDSGNDSVKPLVSITVFGMMINPVVQRRIAAPIKNDYERNMLSALRRQASLMS